MKNRSLKSRIVTLENRLNRTKSRGQGKVHSQKAIDYLKDKEEELSTLKKDLRYLQKYYPNIVV